MASGERVMVNFDDALLELTRSKIAELRAAAAASTLPAPLVDSPKCARCSLVSICLPDETAWLTRRGGLPRQLVPATVQQFPLYVQEPGASVRKKGDLLEVHLREEKLGEARLEEISHVVLFGPVQITTPAIHELCRREISTTYLSSGGWLQGVTVGLPHRNVRLRQKQYATAADDDASLAIARAVVRAKILNMRTILRRNIEGIEQSLLVRLRQIARSALRAQDVGSLLGVEGTATRVYFEHFTRMLKGAPELLAEFALEGRNRRPPRDRINAMLSLSYSLLAREFMQVAWVVGLDPYLGFMHALRYGRPSLALDLMEPFRPLIADSVCVGMVNNGELSGADFVERMGAVNLSREGRAKLIGAFERRVAQEITHPGFGYRASYRRVFEIEARLLGRHLTGELSAYHPLVTR
jgi:CRISPR-associated protein Cas1